VPILHGILRAYYAMHVNAAQLFTDRSGVPNGGFKVRGVRGKTLKKGPYDDVIILSQPW